MTAPSIHLLECTLRDGSYVLDFQFTVADTVILAAALENAGVRLIEIGHGLGLNASRAGKGSAAATDEEYLAAAARTLKTARWGMFFIPGVGRHEDLEMAAGYGMHFVRVGTNATEVAESREYIEHARRLGMFVSANLMKSYVLPPADLAAQAALSEEYGADLVCLVDSAGGMMPDDIRAYTTAMRERLSVPLGFHGHDNLSLGMANVLAAIDAGAEYVDSTLRGMGRGGGNPKTEVLVPVLKKRGIDLGIDGNRLMDIAERVIEPMLTGSGQGSLDITAGYAGFHSSFLGSILRYAAEYEVDPRDLMVGVTEVDRVYAPDAVVEEVARTLRDNRPLTPAAAEPLHLRLSAPAAVAGSLSASVGAVARQARATARKGSRTSVLNVVGSQRARSEASVSPFVQEEFGYVIASVEVAAAGHLEDVIEAADGVVDVLLVDANPRPHLGGSLVEAAARVVTRSRVVPYSDSDVWARSLHHQARLLMPVAGGQAAVLGTGKEAAKLAAHLADDGLEVVLTGAGRDELERVAAAVRELSVGGSVKVEPDAGRAASGARLLAGFHTGAPVITEDVVAALPADAALLDASIGALDGPALELALDRGLAVARPDMRAALAAELAGLLGTATLVTELMGCGEIAGAPAVAGGRIGRRGDVVVDSISHPTRVIGIADGRGKVLYGSTEYQDRVEAVESEIARRLALIEG